METNKLLLRHTGLQAPGRRSLAYTTKVSPVIIHFMCDGTDVDICLQCSPI